MKRNAAFPSNYLKKEDCDPPIMVTIVQCKLEKLKNPSGGEEEKPVLYFQEEEKGLVLNNVNWQMIGHVTGAGVDDSDAWLGHRIVLYHEPNVDFGGKLVGGIRVRGAAAQAPAAPPAPPAALPGTDEPPPPSDAQYESAPPPDDVPF